MKGYLCVVLLLACGQAGRAGGATAYSIETVAGSAPADGVPAVAAQIGDIQGVAADRFGNLYLSDTSNHRVRKVDAAGLIHTIAGTGVAGWNGDGGPATAAQLNLPYGVAVDGAGNIYVADLGNNRVRRIGPDGVIRTWAGNGGAGSEGDGGPATSAQLHTPRNLALDAAGNLYISEFDGHRVRKVSPDGRIWTVAGTGTAGYRGDGGPGPSAQLSSPAGLAVDRTGALYIADSQNEVIRKLSPGGAIGTVLGATAGVTLLTPIAVAVDSAFTVYVADGSGQVRAWSATGQWSTVAGTGFSGFAGDGGLAAAATLTAPRDLAVDAAGILFVADGVRVREVNASQKIQTVAGDGYVHPSGDGGPATAAELYEPSAVALDWSGNLWIADTGTQRVRMVAQGGSIRTVAGTGTGGYNGDGIAAAVAQLNNPMGLTADPGGNLWIADTYNHRVRQVNPAGSIFTFAGTGTGGIGAGGLAAAQTQLHAPRGICANRTGTLFLVDTSNHRVLRALPSGAIQPAAGTSTGGYGGDGGAAASAQLNQPGACALDAAGNLYIADTGNNRIRKVSADGTITTVAGDGRSALLNGPRGVAVDGSGNIFISDTRNNRIRMLDTAGETHTIAGAGAAGFAGDGGPAGAAQLNAPGGLALDGAGNLYVADTGNNRIRRLVPATEIGKVIDPGNGVTPPPPPPPITVVNAASLAAGAVAPGEIVTIYGVGIGPVAAATGVFDAAGLLATALVGIEVRFGGVAAPLFYAQSNQINAQVPYTATGGTATHVETLSHGQPTGAADVKVAAAAPALFPAVVNQDGSINSEAAPAARGTVLTLYATGQGLADHGNVAGQAAVAPYPRPAQPVTLTIGSVAAKLLYAGSAPGFVGLLQINAVAPGGFMQPGPAPVQLIVGSAASPAITIWLQ
jgi:uncharacterized protein (TIGR03437 family)